MVYSTRRRIFLGGNVTKKELIEILMDKDIPENAQVKIVLGWNIGKAVELIYRPEENSIDILD